MTKWKVVYTEVAEQDLRSIYEYIAFTLLEPQIAKKNVRKIMNDISSLDNMPLRHQLYDKEPWHSKGIRVLQTGNFLSFYLPEEEKKTVTIIRIMYGGRNIERHLKDNT